LFPIDHGKIYSRLIRIGMQLTGGAGMDEAVRLTMIDDLELKIAEKKEQVRRTEGNLLPLILGVVGLVLSITGLIYRG
jgi:hypothetical protein